MGVAVKIGEVAKERNISLKELSRRADIPYTTLYHAVKRDSKMDFETVQRIAAELNMPWYELYPTNHDSGLESYDEKLAAACEWLRTEQRIQEFDSNSDWSVAEQNEWIKEHLDEAVNLYNVRKDDLLKCMPHFANPTDLMIAEMGLHSINLSFADKDLTDCVKKIAFDLVKLNKAGQQVAVERVQELTQIPKYQRPTETPPDAPGGADDKDPAGK